MHLLDDSVMEKIFNEAERLPYLPLLSMGVSDRV